MMKIKISGAELFGSSSSKFISEFWLKVQHFSYVTGIYKFILWFFIYINKLY